MINKIDFVAKNLTSNAGIFLLFENAKTNGIIELIDTDLVFDNESTNKIKTFRLKYVFLAGKIIRTARYVVMKLSAKYPYKDVYENCLS